MSIGRPAGPGDRHRRPDRRADHRRRGAARRDRGLPAANVNAFDEIDAAVIGGLADQAAIAITNARLIEELERSQASARPAGRDRTRAARHHRPASPPCASPESSSTGSSRRRGACWPRDGAHLTRMGEDGTYLVPVVVAGATDARTEAGLMDMRVPARRRHQRPRGAARRAGLDAANTRPTRGSRTRAMTTRSPCASACAGWRPRRCARPAARSSARSRSRRATPRSFDAEELDLLQGLADQAAIAITNSTLLTRLRESEIRYRTLASSSPDLVFATDAEGHWTFLSDRARTMLGWDIEDTVGRHFSEVVADGWVERSFAQFAEFVANPGICLHRPSRLQGRRRPAAGAARDQRHRAPRGRDSCRRSMASPATSPSGSVSSTTCTPPRRASATSSRPCLTSSIGPTPRAGSCSWPRVPRRCSAGRRPRSRNLTSST